MTGEVAVSLTEAEKYRRMWEIPEYREFSPGEEYIWRFLEVVRPQPGATVLDVGCGPGRAALWLSERFDVHLVDLVDNCLDEDVREKLGNRFVVADITDMASLWKIPVADHGHCVDVLEHIPPDSVNGAILVLLRKCKTVYFSISNEPDGFGQRIGEPLHLTVQPFDWWRGKFDTLAHIITARDLAGDSIFHIREK